MVSLVVFLSLVIGCSRAPSAVTPSPKATTPKTTQAFQIPSSYTTYTDETSAFSISYPNQWESASNLASIQSKAKDVLTAMKTGLPIEAASMLFFAGLKTAGGYYPSLNIVVEPLPAGVSNIDQAIQAEMLGLKKVDPNYEEISRTKSSVNGRDAVIVEYKGHLTSGGPLVHNLLLTSLSGKTIWGVTCYAKDTDFSQWSSDFNNVVRSLKITN